MTIMGSRIGSEFGHKIARIQVVFAHHGMQVVIENVGDDVPDTPGPSPICRSECLSSFDPCSSLAGLRDKFRDPCMENFLN